MVVEDDDGIRDTLRYAIELDGYPVITAANGRIALELLKSVPLPGLILLDLMMPEMNGIEFFEILRRDPALCTIPVVVVTAISNHAQMIQRTDGVIKKPINLDDLTQVVTRWCGSSELA